jgi:tyrocidine synthetase-3
VFRIARGTAEALSAMAVRQRTTLFRVLLAALNVLLHRYSGATDIIVGSPSAGRVQADLDDQVGCYLNTLVLRNRIDPLQSFASLLAQVDECAARVDEHQAYPFDKLVSLIQAGRDPSRSPVFDVMLILQNDVEDALQLPGLEAKPCFGHNGTAKLDLSFNFKRLEGELLLGIEYSVDIYTSARIEAMGAHLLHLLQAVVHDPLQRVSDLPLADASEWALIEAFNATATPWPQDATLVELFDQQVAAHPQAPAVRWGQQVLSYQALAHRSDGPPLGPALQHLGCGIGIEFGFFN